MFPRRRQCDDHRRHKNALLAKKCQQSLSLEFKIFRLRLISRGRAEKGLLPGRFAPIRQRLPAGAATDVAVAGLFFGQGGEERKGCVGGGLWVADGSGILDEGGGAESALSLALAAPGAVVPGGAGGGGGVGFRTGRL